jgi:hypothetical protein
MFTIGSDRPFGQRALWAHSIVGGDGKTTREILNTLELNLPADGRAESRSAKKGKAPSVVRITGLV